MEDPALRTHQMKGQQVQSVRVNSWRRKTKQEENATFSYYPAPMFAFLLTLAVVDLVVTLEKRSHYVQQNSTGISKTAVSLTCHVFGRCPMSGNESQVFKNKIYVLF